MYPRDYFATKEHSPEAGRIFVLMPYGADFVPVYRVIQEAITGDETCFRAVRADELLGSRNVMREILEGVGRAEVVLADVTGRNPNVFYELGVAHMVLPPEKVVIITQSDDDVPFDIRQYRYQSTTLQTTASHSFTNI